MEMQCIITINQRSGTRGDGVPHFFPGKGCIPISLLKSMRGVL